MPRSTNHYYSDTWAGMYAIAVILDPRLKVDYYKANGWEPELIAHAKNSLVQAVKKYGTATPQSDQTDIVAQDESTDDEMFRRIKKQRVEKRSEMGRYLTKPVADRNVNILEWWKYHADKFPCLARIARDYLAIPATSVPCERAFPGGTDLITNKRGSLNDDSIEICLCLKSWWRR